MKIACTIRTPQHRGKEVYFYVTQTGEFDTDTLFFTTKTFCGHDGQFSSPEDFDKFRVMYRPDLVFIKTEYVDDNRELLGIIWSGVVELLLCVPIGFWVYVFKNPMPTWYRRIVNKNVN